MTDESEMTEEQELKLLKLTEDILIAIANPEFNLSEEEKQDAYLANESLGFFLQMGDFERAIKEGKELLLKLKSER